jgi:hypothetical protein
MDGDILDAVTEWGTRPVADGVSGLYELADGEFSGAVTDGSAWAFVLNGRFVGTFDGTIEGFADASLTAYTAPDMSLPLLYAMQARGGDVRGQYYSNDTSLSEIDDTLSAGNFVGYVELSENVLSGDYYVVYYGGRSLPVAFVGNNRRLLSGDEAFERAADEVGIYSVIDADVEVVDLPDRPEGAPEPAPTPDPEPDSEPKPDSTDNSDVAITPDADATADADAGVAATGTAADPDTGGETADADDTADAVRADTETASDADARDTDFSSLGDFSGVDDADDRTVDTDSQPAATGGAAGSAPDESDDEVADAAGTTDDGAAADTDRAPSPDTAATGADVAVDAPENEAVDADELARLRRERDAAREAAAELEAERDRLATERDDLRAEVERLRERVTELESEIDRLESGAHAADATPERTLDTDEALSGTNLFVRYADKADGTLERAAEGRVSESELRDNLRFDYHTEFETDGVSVDGQSFDTFLRRTPEYRFAEWLLTTVTYEIRRTDTRADLPKLYESIEAVDRIDLGGEVDVTVDDANGGTETASVTFDVVFLNKMGDPLFAAAFDDSRDPTRAGSIRSLLDGARSVSRAVEPFAAAFVVTTSFFDADAMEVAVDATRGGLFSRSSRKSYVKLSRKSGFHLCLVEARDEDFFLTVPEL